MWKPESAMTNDDVNGGVDDQYDEESMAIMVRAADLETELKTEVARLQHLFILKHNMILEMNPSKEAIVAAVKARADVVKTRKNLQDIVELRKKLQINVKLKKTLQDVLELRKTLQEKESTIARLELQWSVVAAAAAAVIYVCCGKRR